LVCEAIPVISVTTVPISALPASSSVIAWAARLARATASSTARLIETVVLTRMGMSPRQGGRPARVSVR
jgi:hypothetical protein